MIKTCISRHRIFDDAEQYTYCPHKRFLSAEEQKQKDAAIALLGEEICFAHQPDGPFFMVRSVGHRGMVEIDGMAGEFAPHLFVIHKKAST